MKKIGFFNIILAACLCCYENTSAQKHKLDHYSFAFTTLHTAYPFGAFSSLFYKEFHPGFEIGTGFNWKAKEKHDWFQTFEFGYAYHRFVQHTIALYSEFGYRYKFLKTFSAEAKLGIGYLHAIVDSKIYVLEDDGIYQKKTNLGHPQAMASFSLGVNKKVSASGLVAFLEYKQRLQLPFINSYVPILPSNMLMIGLKVPFKKNNVPVKS
jgi:hypothetical protein